MAFLLFPILVAARQVVPTTSTDADFQKFYGDLSLYSTNTVLFKDPIRGYGFMLTEDVVTGDEVLRVPSRLIISPNEYFEWSPYIQHFSPQERLISRVLYEKFLGKPDSLRTFFVHSLSNEAPSSPLYWSDEEFKLFNDMALHTHKRSYFLSDFTRIKKKLSEALEDVEGIPSEIFEDDVLKWATFHVVSRVFDVTEEELHLWLHNLSPSAPIDPQNTTKIMVPIIDMSNHLPRPYVYHKEDSFYAVQYPEKYGDDYILRADRNQTAGEEYVWSYGSKNNLHLMDTYGFLLEHNINDYFYITFKDSDYCYEDKTGNWCYYKADRKRLNNYLFRHIYQSHFASPVPKLDLGKFDSYYTKADLTTKDTILEALRKYRRELLSHLEGRKGLREVKRLAKRQQTYSEYMIYTCAIESRETLYTHLMLLDKLYARLIAVI